MQPWKKKKALMRAVRYSCVFEPMEREVLGNLSAVVSEALINRAQSVKKDPLAEMTGIPGGHKEAPEDPAMARLLPDFEMEGDEEYEGDNSLLRSFHEHDITRAKIQNLQVINSALGPDGNVAVSASEEEAQAWLAGLNDIRLYLVSGDSRGGEAAEEDRENLVQWLAYAQESLLEAIMKA